MIIDFHSHCLPGVDHGCSTEEESLAVLKEAKRQGVDVIAATHHFCPGKDNIDEFLRIRNEAAEKIRRLGGDDIPEIILGAEVYLSPDFKEFPRKRELCIEGTDWMLIEMPYDYWMPWVKDAVWSLVYEDEIQPIMAHIERYKPLRHHPGRLSEYEDMGVAKQVNAYSVFDIGSRKFVRELLSENRIDCIGSDVHAPGGNEIFGKALDFIDKKYSLRRMLRFSHSFYGDVMKKRR